MIDIHVSTNSEGFNSLLIGDLTIPAHKYYQIQIDVSHIENNRDKLCIVYLDEGSPKSIGGTLKGDTLSALTNRLGKFKMVLDTLAPMLTWRSANTLKRNQDITLSLKDNLGTLGKAKDPVWKVFIDNVWIHSEFDIKTNLINFKIPSNLTKGIHKIRIQAIDDRLNTSIYNKTFTIH